MHLVSELGVDAVGAESSSYTGRIVLVDIGTLPEAGRGFRSSSATRW